MSMEGLADAMKALIEEAVPPPSREGVANTQSQLKKHTNNNSASPQSEVSDGVTPPPGEREGAVLPLRGSGVILIGHSMGGYITLAFAEKYPELVKAFGLFHSTAFADSEEKKETRRKGIKFIEQQGGYEFLKSSISNLFAPHTKEEKSYLVEEQIEAVRNANGAALVSYYVSMMQRPDRTAVLRDSPVPVLFVLGRHDNAVPFEDGLKLCHLPQLAYIELLENAGHMGMAEEIIESNKILSDFITAIV